jgi:hypothetical protein
MSLRMKLLMDGMAQVVESLSSKYKALSSIPSTTKKEKEREK